MVKQYNLYNLEASFRNFLVAENISLLSLKNYLSDYRYFEGWLTNFALARTSLENTDIYHFIRETLTSITIDEYKSYLVANNFPFKTINRRLSTLRKFCSFCISQGWLTENPAKQLKNIEKQTNIIDEFRSDMVKSDIQDEQAETYVTDINQFLTIIS